MKFHHFTKNRTFSHFSRFSVFRGQASHLFRERPIAKQNPTATFPTPDFPSPAPGPRGGSEAPRRRTASAPSSGLVAPSRGLVAPSRGLVAPSSRLVAPSSGLVAPSSGPPFPKSFCFGWHQPTPSDSQGTGHTLGCARNPEHVDTSVRPGPKHSVDVASVGSHHPPCVPLAG